MRRYDIFFCEEASQYEDKDWERFFTCIREQPHLPYTVVIGDFQQLQPVSSHRARCKAYCGKMETVELESVYRTADEEHLLFQNRIRVSQPNRDTLNQYFSGRILDGSLQDPAVVVNEPTLHPTLSSRPLVFP